MIKGCQKKIIHVKSTNSPYFEEAYFILKDSPEKKGGEWDMLKEAERIAECASLPKDKNEKKRITKKISRFLLFAAGAIFVFFAGLLCAALVG